MNIAAASRCLLFSPIDFRRAFIAALRLPRVYFARAPRRASAMLLSVLPARFCCRFTPYADTLPLFFDRCCRDFRPFLLSPLRRRAAAIARCHAFFEPLAAIFISPQRYWLFRFHSRFDISRH
jgi:hypothetical protein